MSAEEKRIRELAYQIWQSEGCPHGEEERHWEMARKLVEAEKGAPVAKPATRARKTATKPTDATPKVKEAPAAKPRASRASASAKADTAKADTDAKAGTPETIKKTRTPRAKKES
ncbi:conserved hypothetical protein [Stutzerimonas stutzeri A1501]|jgi:hypothetical protein|uniref:DUF2934 domain-containing protein n=1 Tax=Stutzerimonas stutzeri (strain A1501) TaxID=379731 RepID=A4VLF5_STUS1|nr:DUF2934 domain-containing protein [Stutzerimonas stutzeri]ABP79806.1 conserved hypothetical protein [Stutzerimonas stutzeri A1501]UWG58665.1 DUF2934 domain-containing protein [Stutzerimonas stutzeri]